MSAFTINIKAAKKLYPNNPHMQFLAMHGVDRRIKRRKKAFDYVSYVDTNPIKMSNTIPSNGFKKSVDDYKWKTEKTETKETIQEIERKKKAIAPAYSKGAYQYISSKSDVETLGKKV